MKNQREIYEALLAGETLISDNDGKLRLNDAGSLINAKTGESYSWISGHPDIWQIHKEPKWYENIPEDGLLCWIATEKASIFPLENTGWVVDYEPKSPYANEFVLMSGARCGSAKPLTKSEVRGFMCRASDK